MGQLKHFIYPEDKNNADGKTLSSENEDKTSNEIKL